MIGYLNNWADGIIVWYKDIAMLENMTKYANMPIINAMTDINHPCEMLTERFCRLSGNLSAHGTCQQECHIKSMSAFLSGRRSIGRCN